MNRSASHECGLVDWSVATRPMFGETVSGDLHLVHPMDHGVLLAVVDGVGHGAPAASASAMAVSFLQRHATNPLVSLASLCHQALAETRGVVMTLAAVDSIRNTLTWLGVGNVEGRLLHAEARAGRSSECVLLRSGVVGYRLPPLQSEEIALAPGDSLVFATDGIRAEFADGLDLTQTPEQMANHVVSHFYGGTDDALVLVARYRGESHE